MQLGDRTLDNVDVDPRSDTEGRDLLGQDVLTKFCCEYRFGDQELRPGCPPVGAEGHRIQLGEAGHVYLELEWSPDGPAASAVFDTGASVTVVDTAFARTHPELLTSPGTTRRGVPRRRRQLFEVARAAEQSGGPGSETVCSVVEAGGAAAGSGFAALNAPVADGLGDVAGAVEVHGRAGPGKAELRDQPDFVPVLHRSPI